MVCHEKLLFEKKASYLTFNGLFFRYNGFIGTKDRIVITLEPLCFLIKFESLFSLPVVGLFIAGIRLGTLGLVRAAHAHGFAWPVNFWLVCLAGYSGY